MQKESRAKVDGRQWNAPEGPTSSLFLYLLSAIVFCSLSNHFEEQSYHALHTYCQFVITSARLRRSNVAPSRLDLFMQKRFNLIINPHEETFESLFSCPFLRFSFWYVFFSVDECCDGDFYNWNVLSGPRLKVVFRVLLSMKDLG